MLMMQGLVTAAAMPIPKITLPANCSVVFGEKSNPSPNKITERQTITPITEYLSMVSVAYTTIGALGKIIVLSNFLSPC